MNVLVVDDIEAIGMIVSRVVSQGGWHSYYTDNTGEILSIIREKKIDVLLCDYFMPEKNGLEVLRMLRADKLDLPVVFLTGNPEAIDLEEAGRLNVFKILVKPISIPELRSTLSAAKKSLVVSPQAPSN